MTRQFIGFLLAILQRWCIYSVIFHSECVFGFKASVKHWFKLYKRSVHKRNKNYLWLCFPILTEFLMRMLHWLNIFANWQLTASFVNPMRLKLKHNVKKIYMLIDDFCWLLRYDDHVTRCCRQLIILETIWES